MNNLLKPVATAFYLFLCYQLQAGPKAYHLQKFDSDIKVDGYLTEDVWKNATKITDFYTLLPVYGNPAEERTALLLGYDQNNLYVGIVCFYDDPAKVRTAVCKRDDVEDDDFVAFYLDTFGDAKNAYTFVFNPYGIQQDGITSEYIGEDFKPDFVFQSYGRLFKKGYIIEARIPFSSLNFPNKDPMQWRIGCLRRTQYLNHDTIWPKVLLNSSEFLGQLALFNGIHGINGGRKLELLPEFSALRQDMRNATTEKLNDGHIKGSPGLSIKYGISSGLTLAATLNPDFSEIEADASKRVVNRRNLLYYKEKRPFFLEGTEIFDTPLQAVYTRQIVDPLMGIKLSGRVDDYSLGILSALDEYQGSQDYLDSKFGVSPSALSITNLNSLYDKYLKKKSINNIVRLKRNILENSTIGLIATDREFEGSFNRLAGLDGKIDLGKQYILTFQGLYSLTKDINSTKTIKDPAYTAQIWWSSDKLNYQFTYNDYAPNFRAENGFIEREDIAYEGYRQGSAYLWWTFKQDNSFVQQLQPRLYGDRYFDYSGRDIEGLIYPSLYFQFNFKTDLTLAYYNRFERYNGINFTKNNFSIDIENSILQQLQLSFYHYFGDDIFYLPFPTALGDSRYTIAGLIYKPIPVLNIELTANLYNLTNNYFTKADSVNVSQKVAQNIFRSKITWQVDRYFALRLIMEHNESKYRGLTYGSYYYKDNPKELDVDFLLSYTPSPGTVVYAGYNDIRNHSDFFSSGTWPF